VDIRTCRQHNATLHLLLAFNFSTACSDAFWLPLQAWASCLPLCIFTAPVTRFEQAWRARADAVLVGG